MVNADKIHKWITEPASISEADRAAVALIVDRFPYFVPGRYVEAVLDKNDAFHPGHPYMANWMLFYKMFYGDNAAVVQVDIPIVNDAAKASFANPVREVNYDMERDEAARLAEENAKAALEAERLQASGIAEEKARAKAAAYETERQEAARMAEERTRAIAAAREAERMEAARIAEEKARAKAAYEAEMQEAARLAEEKAKAKALAAYEAEMAEATRIAEEKARAKAAAVAEMLEAARLTEEQARAQAAAERKLKAQQEAEQAALELARQEEAGQAAQEVARLGAMHKAQQETEQAAIEKPAKKLFGRKAKEQAEQQAREKAAAAAETEMLARQAMNKSDIVDDADIHVPATANAFAPLTDAGTDIPQTEPDDLIDDDVLIGEDGAEIMVPDEEAPVEEPEEEPIADDVMIGDEYYAPPAMHTAAAKSPELVVEPVKEEEQEEELIADDELIGVEDEVSPIMQDDEIEPLPAEIVTFKEEEEPVIRDVQEAIDIEEPVINAEQENTATDTEEVATQDSQVEPMLEIVPVQEEEIVEVVEEVAQPVQHIAEAVDPELIETTMPSMNDGVGDPIMDAVNKEMQLEQDAPTFDMSAFPRQEVVEERPVTLEPVTSLAPQVEQPAQEQTPAQQPEEEEPAPAKEDEILPWDHQEDIIGSNKDEEQVVQTANEPITAAPEEQLIQPVYAEDYFRHVGVAVSDTLPEAKEMEAHEEPVQGGQEDEEQSLLVMMSFAEWLQHLKIKSLKEKEEEEDKRALRTMWKKEKLAAALEEENDEIPEQVFEMAVNSIMMEDSMISESLADIYTKQGKYDKAIEMYHKLSLRNPQKNSYFASQIEKIKKQKES